MSPPLSKLVPITKLVDTSHHRAGNQNPTLADPADSEKAALLGGVRGDLPGRDCRDAFLGLAKTCAKLGITFWDYLGARLGTEDADDVPSLANIIRMRAATS